MTDKNAQIVRYRSTISDEIPFKLGFPLCLAFYNETETT